MAVVGTRELALVTEADEVLQALRDEVRCIECLAAVKSREAEWLFKYPYHTRCLDRVLADKEWMELVEYHSANAD